MYEENVKRPGYTTTVRDLDQPKGTETRDVPRVSHEMSIIQKLLAEHAEIASQVEQRLHAVLRPSDPETSGNEAKEPRPISSPLSCDLEAFRLQLIRTLGHYNDILNRLEI